MNNIQGYKSFISEYKEKLKSSCLGLIKMIEEEINPKVKEIMDSYDEHFEWYSFTLVDCDGDGISSEYIEHSKFDSMGNWNIHIGVQFLGKEEGNRDLMKEICDRIISEFPDDLAYSYCGGHEILFDIKD